jgi:FkbM family methyltransferase
MSDVLYCYRILLGREPDSAGLDHYAHLLKVQRLGTQQLFELFIRSPEFQTRLKRDYAWRADELQAVNLLDGSVLYVAASGDNDISGAIRANLTYEPEVSAAVRRTLVPGDCFVDVGASIGYFTVLASALVGGKGRVVAIEPGPQNQPLLLLNVASNQLANVQVFPVALSDRREILSYNRLSSNGAVTAANVDAQALITGDLVPALTLDELLRGIERVDLMKIDVEGAEWRVLQGAKETIARCRPTLIFEFTPRALESLSGISGLAMLTKIGELGYGFEILSQAPDGSREESLIGAEEVVQRFDALQAGHVDLLAEPL